MVANTDADAVDADSVLMPTLGQILTAIESLCVAGVIQNVSFATAPLVGFLHALATRVEEALLTVRGMYSTWETEQTDADSVPVRRMSLVGLAGLGAVSTDQLSQGQKSGVAVEVAHSQLMVAEVVVCVVTAWDALM